MCYGLINDPLTFFVRIFQDVQQYLSFNHPDKPGQADPAQFYSFTGIVTGFSGISVMGF